MNPFTPHLQQLPVPWLAWFRRVLAVLLALATLLYGLAAINAGVVNFRGAGNAEVAAKRVAMQGAGEAGRSAGDFGEITGHSSALIGVLSKTSSPQYAYGRDGLSEPLIHYATMPKVNGITLSLHSMLGGTCMLFGALQFWPAFRRRYPKWHRAFGSIYLVSAQVAMIFSMVYLARTPIADIYDQLTFYVGLWGLAAVVTVSLWMSIYSLWRKQIAQHQAWMCLNYGLLLTAPVQRYGWVAFGAMAPQLRQLEANYAVSGVLIQLTLMMGYGLFTVNRWLQPVRSPSATENVAMAFKPHSRFGKWVAVGGLLVLAAASISTLEHFVLAPGMGQATNASTLIPAGVVAMQDAVIADRAPTRLLFAAATLLGCVVGMGFLWKGFVKRRAPGADPRWSLWILAACGVVVGMLLLHWGWQMGMPSFVKLAGGAMNLFGGSVTLLFSLLVAFALAQGHHAWAKEWAIFVLICLVATPSFYWQLPMLGGLGFDARFVQTGHVFRMAEAGGWFLLMGGFVYAIYSRATHGRQAR